MEGTKRCQLKRLGTAPIALKDLRIVSGPALGSNQHRVTAKISVCMSRMKKKKKKAEGSKRTSVQSRVLRKLGSAAGVYPEEGSCLPHPRMPVEKGGSTVILSLHNSESQKENCSASDQRKPGDRGAW